MSPGLRHQALLGPLGSGMHETRVVWWAGIPRVW